MAFGFFAFVAYESLFVGVQMVFKWHFGHQRPAQIRVSPTQLIVALLGMTLMAGAVVFGDFVLDFDLFTWPWLRGLGVVVTLAGLVLSMWSHEVLGSNWFGGVAVYKRHRLVTDGPYKWVRHPLYSGMLLSAAGLVLVGLDILFGLAVTLFIGSYALRIPAEEALMRERFKTAYRQYATTTPALLPRLRRRR